MTEFLILKLEGDDPRDIKVAGVVAFDGEPEDAIKQGYIGEGRYAIVNWSERVEGDLAPGPAELTGVEDSAARAAAAEVGEAEASQK